MDLDEEEEAEALEDREQEGLTSRVSDLQAKVDWLEGVIVGMVS